MNQNRLPDGETPRSAYERAMRHGCYRLAAIIAKRFSLGASEMRRAGYLAFDDLVQLGLWDAAMESVARFDLKIVCYCRPSAAFQVRPAP